MFTTIGVVAIGILIFDYFGLTDSDDLFENILETNLIVTLPITFFWGLQPILNSGRIPKTLYLDESGRFYLNKKSRLDISKIDKFIVVHIQAAQFTDHYYKILFKPTKGQFGETTSEPIYLAEKYSLITFFTYFFKSKLTVVEHLKRGGLKTDRIVNGEASSNFLFWKREK